jgi:ABC-2 type transport system permease protein
MSLLASITVWFFLTVITYIIGGLLESFGVSYLILLRISPSYLFSQASVVILTPLLRFVGPISTEKLIGMVPTALSFSQSLSIVIPQLIFLVGGNFPLFLFSYIKFMRREIRQP